MTLKEAFFKELADLLQRWRDDTVTAVQDPTTATSWAESAPAIERLHQKLTKQDLNDLRTVLDEILRGILHSALVTIDGGTAVAEVGNLALVEAESNLPLTDGALHDEFFEYLAEHDLL